MQGYKTIKTNLWQQKNLIHLIKIYFFTLIKIIRKEQVYANRQSEGLKVTQPIDDTQDLARFCMVGQKILLFCVLRIRKNILQ